jgi:hypothetical protein
MDDHRPDAPGAVHYRLRAEFVIDQRFRLPLALMGVRSSSCGLELDHTGLRVDFGHWRVRTPVANIADAEVTGPYRAVKVLGARLSLADRGLTFGTSTDDGVCIAFHQPVRGIEPLGLLRHPSLTVTVTEPELLTGVLRRIAAGSAATDQEDSDR